MMRSGAIKGAGPFFSGREPHVPAIQSYPTPKQIYLHVTPPTGNSEEAVFVGIESPDTDTLILTQKKQNTRRSLAESVHKIYAAGMYVLAGCIVCVDIEKVSVADAMIDCIEATSIPVCTIG